MSGYMMARHIPSQTGLRSSLKRVGKYVLIGSLLTMALTPAADAQSVPVLLGDFAGLVDIGGRRIYLECKGRGSPAVILIAGGSSSARYWTDDLLPANPPRTMVFPTIATTTRVCAYDRPGTYAFIGEAAFISRSDPVIQPTTAMAGVADLHALLRAAGVPGPYVLAGHSLGGFIARMYASTYPDEVVGMVVIDAYSEFLEPIFGQRWPRLVRLNAGGKQVIPLPGYGGDAEATAFGEENDFMRRLTAASPLRPMPLAVLAHKVPFAISADPAISQGFTSEELEPLLFAANLAQAMLVPNARFFVASKSGHDVHQDQPALVAEAIRQVVAGVQSPDTWYDLYACCRPRDNGGGAVAGDVNGDGKVDCQDIVIVRAAFGKGTGQPGFDPRADVVTDGVIDLRDLAFVSVRLPANTPCQ